MDRPSSSRLISFVLAVLVSTSGGTSAVAAPKTIVAYFTAWGIYARQYGVRELKESGSPARLNPRSASHVP